MSDGNRSYSLRFEADGLQALMFASGNKQIKVRQINGPKWLYMTFNFLTNDAEILGGSVELVANGAVRYTFRIPPQIPCLQFSNIPPEAPKFVVATNFLFNEK